MKKINRFLFLLLGVLSLFASASTPLAYTGPADRSSVTGSEVIVLTCESTQYTGGPLIWRYRDWLNLSAPAGSPNALAWMAAYENVDDPATPHCYNGREGVRVWQMVQSAGQSYPAATVAGTVSCSVPGSNGWCRNASLDLSANEPIPTKKITVIESSGYGNLCTINAASGNCSWSPPEGALSTNVWAVSSFGDTSLMKTVSWKLDKTPPGLSITVPTVDGSNGWFVSAPTLTLSSSDAVSGVSAALFDAGGVAQVVSANGVTTIGASATDGAGNLTTRSVVVKKDSELPTVAVPLSPDGQNGWYVTHPTLSASASDGYSGVASALVALNAGAWQASVSPTDGVSSIAGRATDHAGNVATTGNQTVKVDTAAPSLSLAGAAASTWYTTDVTITASASDALSGLSVTEYRVDGGAWQTGSSVTLTTDGSHNVDFRAIDKAGLLTLASQTIQIDKHSPALSFAPVGTLGNNGWYKTTVALGLNASDPASGLALLEYRLDGGAWTSGASLNLSDGSHTVDARATDHAGNVSTSTFSTKIDSGLPALSTAPAGTAGSGGWYVSQVTVSATASDAMSGLATTEYSLDGGTWTSGATVTVTSDGSHTVDFRATDNAGNRSTSSRTILVDQTLPAVSFGTPAGVSGAGGWYVSDVTLSIDRSDATSGIALDEYRLNGGAWTPIGEDLALTEGVNKIDVRVNDKAGNQAITTTTISIDLTPPELNLTISGTLGSADWYISPVTLTGNSNDKGSGVFAVAYRVDNKGWENGVLAALPDDGAHTVEFRVTDQAGLTKTASHSLKIDHSPPVSSFSNPPEGSQGTKISGTFTFTGSSEDALAGLYDAEISVNDGKDWQPLTIVTGKWSFAWDTTGIPDGTYTILAHAADLAGNHENTARISVFVGNKKPAVDIPDVWWLWEPGLIRVKAGSVALKDATIRIACPLHQDVLLTFAGDDIPNQLQWDRRCGNGAYAAESGDYLVTVSVCDIFGRCAQDTGLIRVPENATPPPTWTPTVVPTATPLATATRAPSSTPTGPVPQATIAPTSLPPAPAPVGAPFPWAGWSLAIFLTLFFALAVAAVIDPRPKALARLRKTLERLENYARHIDGQA